MADAPAYQSGLIAALRGSAPSQNVSVPGMTLTPNAPSPQGSPVLFGGAPMTGNLMTPPRFAPMQGAQFQKQPQQQQQTGNFMGLPIPIPPEAMPQRPAPFVPQMSGNLMPVPQFEPAPDYVAPPPKATPTAPAAPPYYETKDGYRYTVGFDDEGNQITRPWYGYSED